jgi:hypothetical protein
MHPPTYAPGTNRHMHPAPKKQPTKKHVPARIQQASSWHAACRRPAKQSPSAAQPSASHQPAISEDSQPSASHQRGQPATSQPSARTASHQPAISEDSQPSASHRPATSHQPATSQSSASNVSSAHASQQTSHSRSHRMGRQQAPLCQRHRSASSWLVSLGRIS